jgi:hypothetical protein
MFHLVWPALNPSWVRIWYFRFKFFGLFILRRTRGDIPGSQQCLLKDDYRRVLPVYSSDLVRDGLRVLQELQGARERRWER